MKLVTQQKRTASLCIQSIDVERTGLLDRQRWIVQHTTRRMGIVRLVRPRHINHASVIRAVAGKLPYFIAQSVGLYS